MKLICPVCGLKGTADESLRDRNVKCPGCRNVFELNKSVMVGDGPDPRDAGGDQLALQPDDIGVCTSCGFRYSRVNLIARDSGLFCRICTPAAIQAEGAI